MMLFADSPVAALTGRPCRQQLVAALMGISMLAGCGGDNLFKRPVAPPPPLQIENGSTLTLSAPLTFSPGAKALYFQDNQLVSAGAIARDFPYCGLAPTSGAVPAVINPAAFTVQNVEYDDKGIGSAGNVRNVTRILLVAYATQPYTLSCQWPDGGPSRDFLTSEEIQGAIGSHFSMALDR
jgi:hypothetical protein